MNYTSCHVCIGHKVGHEASKLTCSLAEQREAGGPAVVKTHSSAYQMKRLQGLLYRPSAPCSAYALAQARLDPPRPQRQSPAAAPARLRCCMLGRMGTSRGPAGARAGCSKLDVARARARRVHGRVGHAASCGRRRPSCRARAGRRSWRTDEHYEAVHGRERQGGGDGRGVHDALDGAEDRIAKPIRTVWWPLVWVFANA